MLKNKNLDVVFIMLINVKMPTIGSCHKNVLYPNLFKRTCVVKGYRCIDVRELYESIDEKFGTYGICSNAYFKCPC